MIFSYLTIACICVSFLSSQAEKGVDFRRLRPSCEKVWRDDYEYEFGEDYRPFKYPSSRPEHLNVWCLPTTLVRFSQGSIFDATTSGKTLEYWIAKHKKLGYYSKTSLPDVIKWSSDVYSSFDNRRVYCAKKAGIAFLPSHIHSPEEKLPEDFEDKTPLLLNSPYVQGVKVAKTWGENVAFRCILSSIPFPLLGSFDYPVVDPSNPGSEPPSQRLNLGVNGQGDESVHIQRNYH